MIGSLVVLVPVVLFCFGFGTGSYVGALVPGALLAGAVILYQQHTPTGDEVDAWAVIWVVASAVGVVLYLAGVAFGRASRRAPSDGQS
jgi:4-hydroxybenzoate polyprenyltransferase